MILNSTGGLSGCQVDWHRDVFERDQPMAADLAIAVGNANRSIYRPALFIGTGDVLKTVAESDVTIDGDAETGDGDLRFTAEMGEEVFPIFPIVIGAAIFLARYDVKHNEAVVGYIVLHDPVDVAGVEGGCKSIFERTDGGFVAGCVLSACVEVSGHGGY